MGWAHAASDAPVKRSKCMSVFLKWFDQGFPPDAGGGVSQLCGPAMPLSPVHPAACCQCVLCWLVVWRYRHYRRRLWASPVGCLAANPFCTSSSGSGVRTVCNVLALCIWVGGGKEQQLPWAVLLVCVSTHPVQSLGSGGLSFPFLNPVLSCTRNRKASRAAPGSVVGVYAGAARASAAPMLCRLQPPGPGCCAHACTWASA